MAHPSTPPALRRYLSTLAGCLAHGLLASFFVRGFTVVEGDEGGDGEQRDNAGEQGGGGAEGEAEGSDGAVAPLASLVPPRIAPWATSSESMDEARTACISALLACISSTLYVPTARLSGARNRMLDKVMGAPDPFGKGLFRALLSVVFSYDPVGMGLPFTGALASDSHGDVMRAGVQLLLALLSQPSTGTPRRSGEELVGGSPSKVRSTSTAWARARVRARVWARVWAWA